MSLATSFPVRLNPREVAAPRVGTAVRIRVSAYANANLQGQTSALDPQTLGERQWVS